MLVNLLVVSATLFHLDSALFAFLALLLGEGWDAKLLLLLLFLGW